MNSTQQNKLQFSSKAKTLQQLSTVITKGKVLPVYLFPVCKYRENPALIIEAIQSKFKNDKLVIRSSSVKEDGFDLSNAGHYESVLNVQATNRSQIKSAIDRVVSSFEEVNNEDEVFVQPQLEGITMAGVAFTCDLDTLAPYYIVNYDESGSSDSVTSGKGKNLKTFVCYKDAPVTCESEELRDLIAAAKEIESIFEYPFLDIEFAFDSNHHLHIFQVRRISIKGKENLSGIDFKETLIKIHKKITKLSAPHPNLLGDHAVYGVMPDWNPAEIIGLKPKYLSASLYKEIITDNIWAYQRDNYGYRNLRSHPLMLLFLGVPYIDVRVDFNSFIPKELDESISKKLVEHYLRKLISSPVLHDKVEFEIVHSCFYFNLPEKLNLDLSGSGFTKDEIGKIRDSLLSLTNKIIHNESGLYKKDLEQAEKLKKKYDQIILSDLSLVDKIYWLIEDCKRYGTLPFAGIARSAFIATQFLRSFVDLDIINKEDYQNFVGSLNTVTKELNYELRNFHDKKLSKETFLEKYGHLRPGTYDILSARYDENFDNYFSKSICNETEPINFEFSGEQLEKISALIKRHHLHTDAVHLIQFIKASIEGREKVKFIFTRSLSKVLSLIEELAIKYGIAKEDLPYLDIKTILDLYASLDYRDVKEIFERDIEKNRRTYQYTKAVRLPGLITKADDVYNYFIYAEAPNYITLKRFCSGVVHESDLHKTSIENKIVFIKSADPGYDFLFTKKIGALITQFGGANSHMAVRCAELGIPAVIGAGESNFNTWSRASLLEIDCLSNQVRVIS